MVRNGFLSLPTWWSRDLIDDVTDLYINQWMTLYPVFVFRPSALKQLFTVFVVVTVCLSVMHFCTIL